jgi:hypothetical protein
MRQFRAADSTRKGSDFHGLGFNVLTLERQYVFTISLMDFLSRTSGVSDG